MSQLPNRTIILQTKQYRIIAEYRPDGSVRALFFEERGTDALGHERWSSIGGVDNTSPVARMLMDIATGDYILVAPRKQQLTG